MAWNNFAFISLVCALLSAASAVLTLSAKRQGAAFLFGLIASVLAVWSFCLFYVFSSQEAASALFWTRTANYIVLFLPALLFHFVSSFVGRTERNSRLIFSYYLFSVLYLSTILSSPDSFLHSPSLRFESFWFPVGGSLFYLFPLLFTCIIGHAVYVLIQERAGKDRSEKLKLDYLITTFALGYFGGGLSLSLEFDVNIPPYGILSVAFMVLISTYAVLKHDLLELPETLSLVMTRLMIYICIVAFVVLALKGGLFWSPETMSVSQISLVVLMTLVACEFYATVKSRLQSIADRLLIKQKLETEGQFQDLMYQLESSDDFESMLPFLRHYFEHQAFVHHYSWYLETSLLDRAFDKKRTTAHESKGQLPKASFQRILFSGADGRRHDRLPASITLARKLSSDDIQVKDQMVTLMSSEQLDAAYDWVEKVPGREMLGLPVVSDGDFRGILLIVVSKSDMRNIDQSRLQAVAAKLGRLIERVEFFRRESEQEQLFLHRRMQSLQALAGDISYDMQEPLKQLREFVRDVSLERLEGQYGDYMDLSCRRAKSAIARTAQVLDLSLDLVGDDPIDVSTFRTLSIQSVVSKALAEYVFVAGERELIHSDLRQDFYFKGDEALIIRTLLNLVRHALSPFGATDSMDVSIVSEVDSGKNILHFRSKVNGEEEALIKRVGLQAESWENSDLCLSYCERIMRSFGGSISVSSEGQDIRDIRLFFPYVKSNQQLGGSSESGSLSASH